MNFQMSSKCLQKDTHKFSKCLSNEIQKQKLHFHKNILNIFRWVDLFFYYYLKYKVLLKLNKNVRVQEKSLRLNFRSFH